MSQGARLIVALAAGLAAAPWAWAQSPSEEEAARPGPDSGRAIGGPDGVTRRIDEDAEAESIHVSNHFLRWAAPDFDWKQRLEQDHGLSFGLTAHILYGHASDTIGDKDDGFGGMFRFQGSWEAFARNSGHPGRLEWRVENCSGFGGNLSPAELGSDTGAAALNPMFGYSDSFDTDLSVFSWVQLFNDQTAGFAVGRLAFDVYQDPYLFQTFSRGFLNRAFLLNPTAGTTGVGALGAVAKGFAGDNFWIGAQVHDGNAVSGEFDINTVQEGEFLSSGELGWTPSIDRSKTDRVLLT